KLSMAIVSETGFTYFHVISFMTLDLGDQFASLYLRPRLHALRCDQFCRVFRSRRVAYGLAAGDDAKYNRLACRRCLFVLIVPPTTYSATLENRQQLSSA